MRLPPDNVSLKHFVLRQQVFDLYRYAIRSTRSIPDPQARKETLLWIRHEFERNKLETNPSRIEDQIKSTRRDIRRMLPTAR